MVTEPTLDDAADYRFDNLYRVNWIEKLPDYQYQCLHLPFYQICDTFDPESRLSKSMAVMKYYINLFSPNTATAFTNSNRDVTGFRISRKSYVKNQGIKSGDIFICYCTKIQRFIGILEVISAP